MTLLELIHLLINGKQKRLSFPFLNEVLIHNCSLLLRFHSRLTRAYRIVTSKKIMTETMTMTYIFGVLLILYSTIKCPFIDPKPILIYSISLIWKRFFVGLWCWWEGDLSIRFGVLGSCIRIFIKTVCFSISLKWQIGIILCTLALIPLYWSQCCGTLRGSTGTLIVHETAARQLGLFWSP